ncbi:hypothetical protein [Archangium primigenium]|uniref:hypothetical protein n=1 Tax=[Archangium] primigenium TaxID=2792470 RepID=UPI00195654EA|nr:hypothetical protein [Archangium primigenium]MBM7113146.1 hypothetical protein [Archangium primigenium]
MFLRSCLTPAAGLLLCALTGAAAAAPSQDPTFAHAGNARLLSTDEAAPIQHAVIGLQRTALPLALGIVVDTSLLADAALAANVGARWGAEWGRHRFVLGARYTQFLGNSLIADAIAGQENSPVKRFDVSFGGPSAYALYGVVLGPLLVQAEVRHARYQTVSTTATAAAVFNFAHRFAVVGELGVRVSHQGERTATDNPTGYPLRGALGLRYAGENLGASLGVAYVDLTEPMLPYNNGRVPFVPALDLSWTFQ